MAFQRQTNATKVGIGDVRITLFSPDPAGEGVREGDLIFLVKLSDGEEEAIHGNLLARLGDDAAGGTHLTNLLALESYIRTRLNSEVLPSP